MAEIGKYTQRNMNILVKFPTRERPVKFRDTVSKYIELQNSENVIYFVTLDSDDPSLDEYIDICQDLGLICSVGESKGKIHACNRDMNMTSAMNWDIVVLASDDMIPQVKGWDFEIINRMKENFPDTDGMLWFFDGYQNRISTFTIYGKKYYERFGYLYHDSYKSLWCDNEQTEVARSLNKLFYSGECLFKHEHYSNDPKVGQDMLMKKKRKLFLRR